jgi:rhodanese-related sulfurtransferase/DNA-binding HxlR family transcriptional regulator
MKMSTGKDRLYGQFARIGRALASPARLEILDLLSQGEKSVERLAEEARLGMKNTSAHLRTLREAHLVEARKVPPHIYYRLADAAVTRLMQEVQSIARQQLAEVDAITRLYFESPSRMEPIDLPELRRRLETGEVTLLDVRPTDEFRASHIPGALSIPVDELKRRLGEIPRETPVVAYCRGPYCVYARDAVETLCQHGYSALAMASGVTEWRLANYPLLSASELPGQIE